MPKFRVRVREVRVHHLHVDADNEDEAREIAEDLDASSSVNDMHDAWEVIDATEVEATDAL